jgi:hypothetical protein
MFARPKRYPVKSRAGPAINANVIKGACFVLLLLALCVIPFALAKSQNSGRNRGDAKSQPSISSTAGVIGGQIPPGRAEGGPCQYTVTYRSDTIVPGISDTGNHCAWCDTMISLPFPFVLYDQTFNAVMVNSSGRLDFICNNEPSNYTETCLPAPPNNCSYDYTIFALWGEWYTGTSATGCSTWANGCGIFTSVSGTSPNRIFNIEWHAVSREDDSLTANFEVRLYEDSPNERFDVIYGAIQQRSANFISAGVQGPTGSFTQDFCSVPPPQNVSSTYTRPSCTTPTPTMTPTTVVTNTNDSGGGSLRQALADAHDGDTINFAHSLIGRNIGLTTGELVIDKSVTINGPGTNLLGVYRSAQTGFRIFHVMPGVSARIAGLTISNGGLDEEGGGGIFNDHAVLTINRCVVQNSFASALYGGGVYNDGSGGRSTLTILNSTVTGNFASAGGGIYNDADNDGSATLSLIKSVVDSNTAAFNGFPTGGGAGGGIANGGGTLMITNSVVTNNLAGVPEPFALGDGGGIISYGTLVITNSTISANQAYSAGGGIESDGTLTITSSTISGNGAIGGHDGQPWGHGGGIAGNVTFTNSTLSGNYASLSGGGLDGGGVVSNSTVSNNNGGGISASAALQIANTILKTGARGPNISIDGGTVMSHGYNVSNDDGGGFLNGPGDQINTDPLLGPLQNNGGPTFTHALLPGSPAINAGDPNFTPPPYYDQRGPRFRRVFNGRIDVGALEVQPEPPPFPTPRPRPTPPRRP